MGVRVANVAIDTNDVATATTFWQSVTGYTVASSDDDATYLEDPNKTGPGLSLLRVPEPRNGKNRLHLDLYTSDLLGETERVKKLGAAEVRSFAEGDGGWVILADPDGNEFCICAE